MATRGIIAVQRANGWRGRYVHWDNYPERIVPIIGRLVERDGATKVVTTLINDNQSWSVIDDTQKPYSEADKDMAWAEGAIEGYGVIHTDLEPNDPSTWFTEDDTELAWASYVYVIRDIGVEVLKVERTDADTDVAVPHAFHLWEEIPNLPHPYMVGA
jgi:hypothetical protein